MPPCTVPKSAVPRRTVPMAAELPQVRDTELTDLPAILELHNAAIAAGTAIWDTEPVDLAERERWLAERRAAGTPVLTATVAGRFAGYAGYRQWWPKAGYRHTMENSVYVAAGHRRSGVASALLAELLARARASGVHAMGAAIESGNVASIALHRNFGFQVVGELPEVGRKFDRWLDLTLMQLTFEARVASEP